MRGVRASVLKTTLVLLLVGAVLPSWSPQQAIADPLVWVRQFHFDDGTFAKGIAADASGLYVVGESFRWEGRGYHGFLSKYDLDGDRLWSRFNFGGKSDPVQHVATGPSGVYVLA